MMRGPSFITPEMVRKSIDIVRCSLDPSGETGEALDVIITEYESNLIEQDTISSWRSDQIGALMIAATEAIDMVESMLLSSDNPGLTAKPPRDEPQ